MQLDERLDRLRSHAAPPAGPGADAVESALARTRRRVRSRRRRRATVLVGAVATVVAVAAVGLVAVRSQESGDVVDVVSDDGRPHEGGRPRWTELAPGIALGPSGPLGPRDDLAAVAVDGALVAWGGDLEGANVGRPDLGDPTYADGAVFRPEVGWARMSPSPLPGGAATVRGVAREERHDVVLARGTRVASYDVRTDRWRRLPDLPAGARALFWTGSEVVAITRGDGGFVLADGADASGSWHPTAPPAGMVLDDAALAWTGEELYAVAVAPDPGRRTLLAMVWDAGADRWRALPAFAMTTVDPQPIGLSTSELVAAWTGSSLVVVAGYDLAAARYTSGRVGWEALPQLPMASQDGGPQLLVVGDHVLAVRHDVVAVLAGTDQWVPLPGHDELPGFPAVASGGTAYGYGYPGGTGRRSNSLGRIRVAALAHPATVRLGSFDLSLGAGDRLLDARATSTPEVELPGRPLRARLESVDGSCTLDVTSSYLGPEAAAPTLSADGRIRVPAGTLVEGAPGSGVIGWIGCDDPADATRFVASLTRWER